MYFGNVVFFNWYEIVLCVVVSLFLFIFYCMFWVYCYGFLCSVLESVVMVVILCKYIVVGGGVVGVSFGKFFVNLVEWF